MSTTITNRTDDTKNGMTLGELVVFVQDCSGADLDLHAKVRVVSGVRGQVKQIEATG